MYRLLLITILTFVIHCRVFSQNTIGRNSACFDSSQLNTLVTKGEIKVGVVSMNPPYIKENGDRHDGFVMDVIEKVMNLSGYEYEYHVDTYSTLMKELMCDSLDIVFGCTQSDPLWSQLLYSIPYEDVKYKVGKLHDSDTDTQKFTVHTIALCEEDRISSDIIFSYFPNSKQVFYSSLDKAAYAVYQGQCDLIVCKESVIVPNDTISQQVIDFSHTRLDTNTHLSACVKIKDHMLMRDVNGTLVALQDKLLIQVLRRNWFGDKNELTSEYLSVQRYLRVAIVVCAILFFALFVVFVWVIYVTYMRGRKKSYMLRLFNKIPVPLYILRKRRKKIIYEYVNDVAKEEKFASRHYCTAEQSSRHNKRLLKAYDLAMTTNDIISFVDRRKPSSPFSVYVNSAEFDEAPCGVKTVVNNEELLVLKEEAEQNDRHVDEFLANISHEVRTPLNSILGFSQMLPELPPEERQEALSIVEEKSIQLNKLINDILLLAKLETMDIEVNPVPCKLYDWIPCLLEEYTKSMYGDKPVDIIFDNSMCQCTMPVDKGLVSVLLDNLIQNAIKFTHEGEIHVGYLCVSRHLVFYVKDTGIGMSKEECDNIFHRFTKVNTFTQGTGLGVPIALAISRLMNGYLGVHSIKGEGTTFYFMYSNALPKSVQCMKYRFSKLHKIEEATWVDDFSIDQLK